MDYQLDLNWPDLIQRNWQKRQVVLKRGFKNYVEPTSPVEMAVPARGNQGDRETMDDGQG